MDGRKIIKYALAFTVVAIVIGYSYFALGDFVRGPRIVISSPESGFSTTTPIITIVGRVIHINTLAINGDPTPFDLEGNFSSRLILAPGYNIMKVTAKDRYERTVEEEVEMNLIEYGMLNMEYRMDSGAGTTHSTGSTSSPQAGSGQATTTLDTSKISNF